MKTEDIIAQDMVDRGFFKSLKDIPEGLVEYMCSSVLIRTLSLKKRKEEDG